jgi:hypothetical protein
MAEVTDVLTWHVATQLTSVEQKNSELLFPAEDGGVRFQAFLKKAFAKVGELTGLSKRFTPRGMCRTFNDLMRVANVEAVVTKSLRSHDRANARARLHRHAGRAAPKHRQRRQLVRTPPKWGGNPQKWGGAARGRIPLSVIGLVLPVSSCRRDTFRTLAGDIF